jgi:hypothetical protein
VSEAVVRQASIWSIGSTQEPVLLSVSFRGEAPITTYQESLSRLAGEVNEAAAEEVPAPMTPMRSRDSAYTPSSSGRR